MALESVVEMMRETHLFSHLSDEPLRLIAFGGERISRRAGARLFTEGAPAFTGYMVVEGTVELKINNAVVAVAESGDMIGELALICETSRPATAVMRTDGVLLEIPRLVMRRVLEEYPQVAHVVRRTLATRLAAISGELQAVRTNLLAFDGTAASDSTG